MKAITIMEPDNIQFTDVERPKVGPKDVLTKVKYCGICGTDMAILGGTTSLIRDGLIKYPVRIGHEWSGIVEEVGEEVTGFKPGDRVVGDDSVACGNCRPCMEGRYGLCENSRAVGTVNCWDGAFAEYMVMPYRQMYKLPDNIPLDEAALIEPAGIALNGLKQSNIDVGSKVLIIGTGPIGLAAAGLAKNMGAAKILVSGRKEAKLDVGKFMGADVTINVTGENLVDVIKKETDGKGVDAVIETSGNISVVNQALEIVKPGGVIALIGFYEADLNGFNIDKVTLNCITMKGIAGTPNVFPAVIDLLGTKRLSLKPLITDIYPFNKMMEAVRAVKEKNDTRIKVLVEIDN